MDKNKERSESKEISFQKKQVKLSLEIHASIFVISLIYRQRKKDFSYSTPSFNVEK